MSVPAKTWDVKSRQVLRGWTRAWTRQETRQRPVNNLLRFFALMFLLSACAHAKVISANEKRVFELYAKAALYELCGRESWRDSDKCKQLDEHLMDLQPELYFFEDARGRQVLVMFELNNFYPNAALFYNKDGWLKVIERIVGGFSAGGFIDRLDRTVYEPKSLFANKQERIEAFTRSGVPGNHNVCSCKFCYWEIIAPRPDPKARCE